MSDLSAADIDRAKLVFGIYDSDGSGKVDASYLGDAIRALEVSPTNAMVEKLGGTKKKGEKMLTLEEFLPIFGQVKKEKEMGTLEDFLEGLKVYDKAENGTMLAAELYHVLTTLGERLTDEETDIIMQLAGTEDEDGFIKYEPWLKQILAGPFPKTEEQ